MPAFLPGPRGGKPVCKSQWTYDIPKATDGISYSELMGSNSGGEAVVFGEPTAPDCAVARKGYEAAKSWVCGAQWEHWLKPGSIMPTSCLRSAGWSGNTLDSYPIVCYTGVVNTLARLFH